MDEKLIEKFMNNLEISREEAIQLIADDLEVDKMKRTSEIDGDLTAEQRKVKKQASQADRKKTVYKFEKKKRKANDSKRELIEVLQSALEANGCTDIEVTNIEREIVFFSDGAKYKVVLSAPRS